MEDRQKSNDVKTELDPFDVVSEKPSRKKANNHLKRLDCVYKGNMLVSQRQTVDPENKIYCLT